jgi:16S rRNA (adenine1518-N6/adenine1519-N6)-dimethyltransferase
VSRHYRPRLGQHFLHDRNILRRIASALPIEPGRLVVEIGPGQGALTEHLLDAGARLTAIELDSGLAARLREGHAGNPDFDLIECDVLDVDLKQVIGERSRAPALVVGNLPYYITSPILRKVFDARPLVSEAVFLVQKEVALRIAAGPGSPDYGYLSVLCRLHSEPQLLFSVGAGAFRPPPRVTSAVVRLTMRPGDAPDARFIEFLQCCFRQRRKTLRNNLSGMYSDAALAAAEANRLRAEQLGVDELRELWIRLESV